MTLTIAIKNPAGIVLAAESRITVDVRRTPFSSPQFGYYDGEHKLLTFRAPNTFAGVLVDGIGSVNGKSIYQFLPDIEAQLPAERLSVQALAEQLSAFFLTVWDAKAHKGSQEPDIGFTLAGYDEGADHGRLFRLLIPSSPEPQERFPGPKEAGMLFGGYSAVAERLLRGYELALLDAALGMGKFTAEQRANLPGLLEMYNDLYVPLESLPLDSCAEYAAFLIRTTIDAQRFSTNPQNCGGPITTATITRHDGVRIVQPLPV